MVVRRSMRAVVLVLGLAASARAQGHHGGGLHLGMGHHHHWGYAPSSPLGAGVGTTGSTYQAPIGLVGGAAGFVPFASPFFLFSGGGWLPPTFGPPPLMGPGLFGPWAGFGGAPAMAPPLFAPQVPARAAAERPRKSDPARMDQMITLGDRLFRHGNLKRAEERYLQAQDAAPEAAAPRVRLAQVALLRGKYAEAADRFREAQAAEPGWLVNAGDIQAIYAEPGDFAAPLNKLEAHLQAHPGDRDAWFVLGAQYFLSGRTRQASDIFVRLSDRRADPTLAAFRDAATADDPARR